jgi:MoxR-like ATPase
MLEIRVPYPSRDEELLILDRMSAIDPSHHVNPVLEASDLFEFRKVIDAIYVDDRIKGYIVDIIQATRRPADFQLDLAAYIQFGASPRGTIFLTRAARAQAFLAGRHFVTPQDVKSIAVDVLRHRLGITYEAEAEEVTAEKIIERILNRLTVP